MHIGKKIKDVFDTNHPNRSVVWLAEQLNCTRTNIYDIFDRSSIDTSLLMRMSVILQYDFFSDISIELKSSLNKPS